MNTYQYRFSDSTLDLVNLNIVIFLLTLLGAVALERLLRLTPERAVIFGLGSNQANIDITHLFIWPALENFSNALVMIALFTLGVQLSRTPFQFFKRDVLVASFGRLVMGPGIALVCLWIYMSVLGYDLPAVSAQVMFISAAVPSGVNTALIAAAMHYNADFATQIVVATTVLSAITLPGVIMLANILYAI